MELSKCCNAPVKLVVDYEPDKDCTKCGKPCEVVESTGKLSPSDRIELTNQECTLGATCSMADHEDCEAEANRQHLEIVKSIKAELAKVEHIGESIILSRVCPQLPPSGCNKCKEDNKGCPAIKKQCSHDCPACKIEAIFNKYEEAK